MSAWKEVVAADAPDWSRGREFRPMPAWQREAIDVVVHDLWASRPASLCFSYEPHPISYEPHPRNTVFSSNDERDRVPILWAWVDGEQGVSGTALGPEASPAERAVQLADWLQEQVIWESDAAWAEAIPPCPGHRHPARPELVDGEAWWICPNGSGKIARIGQMG
jgi:hypothetical protein